MAFFYRVETQHYSIFVRSETEKSKHDLTQNLREHNVPATELIDKVEVITAEQYQQINE